MRKPGKTPQVRLSAKATRKLKKITKSTKRSLSSEVDIAIEVYRPRFIDNGN